MTTGPAGTEFTGTDSYITRQLREAAATLTSHASTQAKLAAVLRAAGPDGTSSDVADAIHTD